MRDSTQFADQFGNLPGASQAEVLEGDAGSAAGMKNCDGASDTELHAVRDEADFDMRSTLKTDRSGFDETPGEAEIENPAA